MMRGISLELPVKAPETAVLAGIVFDVCEGGPINDLARKRIAGQIKAKRFESFHAFAESLQRGPIHPSTYYIAVDPPFLLRLATASSPSSGLFPGSILIGRMRANLQHEAVINAVSFKRSDHAHIRIFAEQIDRDFLPRSGKGPHVRLKVSEAAEVWHGTIWDRIRAGSRGPWTATLALSSKSELPAALEIAGDFTGFSFAVTPQQESLAAAVEMCQAMQAKRGRRVFDCELEFSSASPERIEAAVKYFREHANLIKVNYRIA